MLLDKSTVISLLDHSVKGFDSYLIAINTLPDDAVFDVYVEDIVTAEYYDENLDELFIFELNFDYETTAVIDYKSEQLDIEKDIKQSLIEQKNNVNKKSSIGIVVTICSIVSVLVLLLILYVVI